MFICRRRELEYLYIIKQEPVKSANYHQTISKIVLVYIGEELIH